MENLAQRLIINLNMNYLIICVLFLFGVINCESEPEILLEKQMEDDKLDAIQIYEKIPIISEYLKVFEETYENISDLAFEEINNYLLHLKFVSIEDTRSDCVKEMNKFVYKKGGIKKAIILFIKHFGINTFNTNQILNFAHILHEIAALKLKLICLSFY